MGYASALAWVLFLVIAGFTAVNFIASRYWVHYDD
jgi:multiple sugar transport system permease protein